MAAPARAGAPVTPQPVSPAPGPGPGVHGGMAFGDGKSSSTAVLGAGAAAKKGPLRRVGPYQIGRTLGEGTFGKVKYALDTSQSPPVPVAIKVMDKRQIREYGMGAQIKKEIAIMRVIRDHPSVVRLLQVLVTPTHVYLVLELVTGGELFDRIVTDGRMDEGMARAYWRQLIAGLEYCHALKVVHRDLKPENLLLDARGALKISDFGLSALASNPSALDDPNSILHTACGTPNYVAPEVLMDSATSGYDGRAADVWSAGVILYVLLAGFLPFDEGTVLDLFRKIVKADFSYPKWMSPEAISLLSSILNPDPVRRATIAQIKASAWFRGAKLDAATPTASASASVSAALATGSAPATPAAAASTSAAPTTPATPATLVRPADATASSAAAAAADAKSPPTASSAVAAGSAAASPAAASSPATAPRMNAFDLINRVGGAALQRLFTADKESSHRPFRQFITSLPQAQIRPALAGVLDALALRHRAAEHACKFVALAPTAVATAGTTTTTGTASPAASVSTPGAASTSGAESSADALFVVQVFEMTPALHMVECRQEGADNRTFIAAYAHVKHRFELLERAAADAHAHGHTHTPGSTPAGAAAASASAGPRAASS